MENGKWADYIVGFQGTGDEVIHMLLFILAE